MENKKPNNTSEHEFERNITKENGTAKGQTIDRCREMGKTFKENFKRRDSRYLSQILVTKAMKPAKNLLYSLINIKPRNTNRFTCRLHFSGTVLNKLSSGVYELKEKLQEETKRCRGGLYLQVLFSDYLSSSRSVLKSI